MTTPGNKEYIKQHGDNYLFKISFTSLNDLQPVCQGFLLPSLQIGAGADNHMTFKGCKTELKSKTTFLHSTNATLFKGFK